MNKQIGPLAQVSTEKPVISVPSQGNPIDDFFKHRIDLSNGVGVGELFWVLLSLGIGGKLLFMIPIYKAARSASAKFVFVSKEELRLKNEIDALCNRLMSIMGADRVILGFFHNGTKNALGIHEKKVSAMFEVTDRLRPIKDQVKSVPIEKVNAELSLCDTKWQTIVRTDRETLCDQYLDRVDSCQKDFKFLSKGNNNIGIINVFYLTPPETHFLDETEDGLKMLRQVNVLMSKLEYNVLLYLKPDESAWLKTKHRFLSFFKFLSTKEPD